MATLCITSGVVAPPPTTSPADPVRPVLVEGADRWELSWRDEFDYADAELDKNWESQNGPSGHILSSRWRENARVENGTLRLINRKEKRGGQEWTSGNIWTREWFQYGYFECRYRYAAAEGTNNSFWIMVRGDEPKTGKRFEIDINEGHYPNKVNTNIHNHTDVTVVDGKRRHPSAHRGFTFGQKPDHVIQLEIPVTTRKLRFISDEPSHCHLREFRIYGVNTGSGYPNVLAAPPKDGPRDFARDPDTKVSVSGFHESQKPEDLRKLTDGDPTTSWISQPAGDKWVEFEFADPRTVGCIQFINGWQQGRDWRGMVTRYRVQYLNGENWVDIASFDASRGGVDFARDFHVFGLEWSESELVFYVDGKEIRREKNAFCHSPAPIWLSLAIIPWAGKVTDAIDGTFMEVDYVRVFKRKP
jgi:beta-glucanase (GH16 family)